MSGEGAPPAEELRAEGLKVAVVAARWHATVVEAMLERAVDAVLRSGATATVVRVPGAFELPVAALHAARAGHDAVVCLGVVVRGGTPHFDYVCQAATDGCTRVALDTGVPVGFGLLTCDDDQQALDRSGLPGSKEDKGREAAEAAIATALAVRAIADGR